MKKIPLVNLLSQHRSIKKQIEKAVLRVLDSGWFILGQEVESFEKEFASYLGARYTVGVASGTDALTLSLKALDLQKSDGVVLPANVYPTAFGVALSGARVQLADVDPATLNISADTLRRAVDKNTKAVVVVHLYGNPVDLDPILEFTKKKKIHLIEDSAQAAGAEYKGRKVGTFGDISCFSFYPTKNLGAYGDGGAVVTDDERLARKIKLWRMYGERSRYDSILVGHNSRLDELQAAILRVKLVHFDEWNVKRRSLADEYKKRLDGLPIEFIAETPKGKSVFHLLVVKAQKRNRLSEYLRRANIGTGVHYPVPIHLTTSFYNLGYKRGDFPLSEEASRRVLSLPIYPEMSMNDVKLIADLIRRFYKQVKKTAGLPVDELTHEPERANNSQADLLGKLHRRNK